MLINYVFIVIIQIFPARMVYYTLFGNISENWNKIIKIRDSRDTFMVAPINSVLIPYGFTVVSPCGYHLIPVCPLNTKPSDLKNSAI